MTPDVPFLPYLTTCLIGLVGTLFLWVAAELGGGSDDE